jgi:hypothetical protein
VEIDEANLETPYVLPAVVAGDAAQEATANVGVAPVAVALYENILFVTTIGVSGSHVLKYTTNEIFYIIQMEIAIDHHGLINMIHRLRTDSCHQPSLD